LESYIRLRVDESLESLEMGTGRVYRRSMVEKRKLLDNEAWTSALAGFQPRGGECQPCGIFSNSNIERYEREARLSLVLSLQPYQLPIIAYNRVITLKSLQVILSYSRLANQRLVPQSVEKAEEGKRHNQHLLTIPVLAYLLSVPPFCCPRPTVPPQ
jgi:hypothetical protein